MAVKIQGRKAGASGARGSRASDGPGDAAPSASPLGTPGELLTPEIRKYRSMLDENPASRIFATLAELYRKQGMYDEAIGLCLKGLKHHPNYLSGRVALGLAYFDKGMIREASEELERVVSEKPDHLMAAKVLGDVLLMSGDIERAKYYFERVLSLAPDDLDVKKKLEPMRTGRMPSAAAPAGADAPAAPEPEPAEEIIEGEGLEIVETDEAARSSPKAPAASEDVEAEDAGMHLTADEMTDILIRTERQLGEIESARSAPAAAPVAAPPAARPRPAAASGAVQLYQAVERMQIGIVITDLDGTVHYANPSVAASHGWDKEDLVGRHLMDFFPPGLFQPMAMHEILEKKSLARDTMNVRRDGSVFPVRITYDVVESESREPVHIIIGMDDLTRHKDVDEDLWQLVIKDVETGLFNRRHFLFKIAEEIKRAERIGYPLCLMVFAINDFKSYQTQHGPRKAQRVLTEIGKITRQSIRKEVDSAYRLTEDEFAVILPTATDKKALIVAERITGKIAKKLPDVEIRIGTASREEHRSIEDLIDFAEKAAYLGRETARQRA